MGGAAATLTPLTRHNSLSCAPRSNARVLTCMAWPWVLPPPIPDPPLEGLPGQVQALTEELRKIKVRAGRPRSCAVLAPVTARAPRVLPQVHSKT
jgi:hypothetical protein